MNRNNKLKKYAFKWRSLNHTAAVQWHHNKPVNILTTAFDPSQAVDVYRTQKTGEMAKVKCLLAVAQ